MARPEGLEPPTDGLEIRCSIQLSYGRGDGGARLYPTPAMCFTAAVQIALAPTVSTSGSSAPHACMPQRARRLEWALRPVVALV